ncbi:Uncharacterised protein [Mycobacteroides abscessus subsp. abscessus]|nr:Uncharacterised protein [Mycobacteroides abscessus subsp. abscessus]
MFILYRRIFPCSYRSVEKEWGNLERVVRRLLLLQPAVALSLLAQLRRVALNWMRRVFQTGKTWFLLELRLT